MCIRLLGYSVATFVQFERDRIRERINGGVARAKRQGQKLGRRRQRISARDLERVAGLSVREAAKTLRPLLARPTRTHAAVLKTSQSDLSDRTANDEGALPA